jgi:hypothetical protein
MLQLYSDRFSSDERKALIMLIETGGIACRGLPKP